MRYAIILLVPLLALLAFACGGGEAPKPAETLAFLRGGDVWLIDADGNGERRITQFAGTDREASSFQWLPSGQVIAWLAKPVEDDALSLGGLSYYGGYYGLSSVDGQVLWQWQPSKDHLSTVVWSPDGERVALSDETGVRIEDRRRIPIWAGTGSLFSHASWSADSQHFALVDGNDILIVTRDGDSTRLDVGPPLDVFLNEGGCVSNEFVNPEPGQRIFGRPVFTPEGTGVLVPAGCSYWASSVGQPADIYLASLDGRINRPILTPAELLGSPCIFIGKGIPSERYCPTIGRLEFSADASQLAYLSGMRINCLTQHVLEVFDSQGGNRRGLLPEEIENARKALNAASPWGSTNHVSDFAWLPTGGSIAAAFTVPAASAADMCAESEEIAAAGLYLFTLDGDGEKKLADEAARNLSWSSSGDLLAYETESPEVPQIHLLNVDTGEARDLGPGQSPAWQPQP